MFYYVDDYNSNIERLGNLQMFLELDLISFDFEDMHITNPIIDETSSKRVLPSEYYGKSFLNSDFMDKRKVESAINLIFNTSEKIVKKYCLTNELNFIYDYIEKKFIISNKDFKDKQNNIIQYILNFDLNDELIEYINGIKKFYIKEGGND